MSRRPRSLPARARSAPRRPPSPRNSCPDLTALEAALDSLAAAEEFSGVVRVDRAGDVELARAYGMADRRHAIANTLDTQFAIASATKGLTALTVVSLIEDGALALDTPARAVLGDDLPLISGDVTVEHLLAHRSGVGDYVDEDVAVDVDEYLLPVPVSELTTTESYLTVLGGHPPKFRAGEAFSYCNGGYVVLALIAERAGGAPFHELVRRCVCEPAGMGDTRFLRSDELSGRAALGYLQVDNARRTNVFNLPVWGSGDGGIYSTAADVSALWSAFFAGRIVSPGWVAEMVRRRSDSLEDDDGYGLGFWLRGLGDAVMLEGHDAGVSVRSVHDPASDTTFTVLSNTSEGAWPIARLLDRST